MAAQDIPTVAVIMLYGFLYAAQSLKFLIDQIFRRLYFVYSYIDDAVIASKNSEKQELIQRWSSTESLKNRRRANSVREIDFHGHHINEHGISPLLQKRYSIVNYPTPQNVNSLRRLLEKVKYYRRFVPDCARESMKPLIEAAFTTIQQHLLKSTMLSHLNTLIEAQQFFTTDASRRRAGVFQQQTVPLPSFFEKLTLTVRK